MHVETIAQIVGRRIREHREARDRTQEWLAESMTLLEIPWSRHTALRTEQGKREPNVRELVAIAFCLGCQPSDLIPELPVPVPPVLHSA